MIREKQFHEVYVALLTHGQTMLGSNICFAGLGKRGLTLADVANFRGKVPIVRSQYLRLLIPLDPGF